MYDVEYNKYLKKQASKLDKGMSWLDTYEKDYLSFLTFLIPELKLKKKQSVVCLGARRGVEVRAWLNCGYLAEGIDVNPGLNNKLVIKGDFHKLPYENNSKDILYTNCLDHVFNMDVFLNEAKRVLRSDGHFLVILASQKGIIEDKYACFLWKNSDQIKELFLAKNFGVVSSGKISNDIWQFDEWVLFQNII